MIAFSTQPGNVALDGQGRNSPFTGALLRHIATEGTSINDVMIDVRNDVLKATDGKQVPWENSSLTGQFFFKPAALPTVADKSAETAAQIAALHQEIDRLQADQGARLTSQQEQLEILQQKLASETKTADQLAAQKDSGTPTATNRLIAVEPAGDSTQAPANAAVGAPAPQPEESVAADTKVALADTNAEGKAPEAAPPAPAPLPEGVTRAIAEDIVSALKELDCYQGKVNGTWGEPAQDALERFNRLAKLDLPVDEPEQATLAALKDWKGPHCTIQAAVPRAKAKSPKYQAVKPPANTYKKTVTPRPYQPKAAARPTPRPRVHSGDNVGDEQRELQRAFPSTNWPGSR
jgi:caspase domain-containing protein